MTMAASHILMVNPVSFRYNSQTAVNNSFQIPLQNDIDLSAQAMREFNGLVDKLRSAGVHVNVMTDQGVHDSPDAVFPNNWISLHEDGSLILYPMFAENRRTERNPNLIARLKKEYNITELIDLTGFEKNGKFLEGTGSMVLDRENRIVYACESPRTDKELVNMFCTRMEYEPFIFQAVDVNNNPVYHTNVVMCVADDFVVLCLESVLLKDRHRMADRIERSGKMLIPITMSQMNHFAGNMLQIQNNKREKLLVMSTNAYNSLSAQQLKMLCSFNKIIHAPLDTIERHGGGSARCMIAEIYATPR